MNKKQKIVIVGAISLVVIKNIVCFFKLKHLTERIKEIEDRHNRLDFLNSLFDESEE